MASKFIAIPMFIECMDAGDNRPARIMVGKLPKGSTILPNVMSGEPIHVGYATQSQYGERQSLHVKNLINKTLDIPLGARAKGTDANVLDGISDLVERPARGKTGDDAHFIYRLLIDGEQVELHETAIETDERNTWRDQSIVRITKATKVDAPSATNTRTRATASPVKADDANAAMLARVNVIAMFATAGIEATEAQIQQALG